MAKQRVKLSEILDGMESQSDESQSYLNVKTGKVEWVMEEHLLLVEDDEPLDDYPDWERKEMEVAREVYQGSPDFLRLPDRFEINEWDMMADFARSRPDEEASDALENAIHGHGAFRHFKDTVHRLGLANAWYRFRDEQYKQIAVDWCEEHELEYEDDLGGKEA